MIKKTFLTAAAAAALLSYAGAATDAVASGDKEKCYGVVKAGKNDCGSSSGSHSCAGQATADGAADEWVYLPAGTCGRLAGGSVEPHAADEGHAE